MQDTETTWQRTADDKRYQIGIPWKENKSHFQQNYKLALKWLENTEKCLEKKPIVKELYKKKHKRLYQ